MTDPLPDAASVASFIQNLSNDVSIHLASSESGDPEIAWGDYFFYADTSDGDVAPQRQPFATIVTKDYPGFDDTSDLDRPGVFRLNISLSRTSFEALFPDWDGDADLDVTVLDTLIPHPTYWRQRWAAVLNPTGSRLSELEPLILDALEHARR